MLKVGIWLWIQGLEPRLDMKIAIILIFTFLTLTAGCGYFFYLQLSLEHAHDRKDKIFSVARGKSTDQIISQLEKDGIIMNKLPLRLYIKFRKPDLVVRTGDYKFASPITPLQVLEQLSQGGVEHGRLTIVEGWTVFDIAKALSSIDSLKLKGESQALLLLKDPTLVKDLDPQAKNLEGYLFPDTYFVQVDTRAPELIEQMVERFKAVWQNQLKEEALAVGMSAHDTVTAASVIETEAKLTVERPVVASVIYNRLKKGMHLSMDSTVVYASKLAGKWKDDGIVYRSDLNLNSPYNTRKYRGLPPGPVGNPGLSSLKAALNPARTSYIYYVRDPDRNDGTHSFFATSQDFELAVKKLRQWEESQRKAGLR